MSRRLTTQLRQLEQAYQRGEFGRTVFMADQLLSDPANDPIRAQVLFFKGAALIHTGPMWDGVAMSCLREALAVAGKEKPIKAKIMGALGGLYGRAGDYVKYDQLMIEYHRLNPEKNGGVRRWGAYVWHNYGVALEHCFRWSDAAVAFTKASELAFEFLQEPGMSKLHAWAVHNTGGVLLYGGQLEAAAEAIARVEALHLPDLEYGHKLLSRRAEYATATGDYVGAQQWLTAALLHPSIDDKTQADVYFTWGQVLTKLERPTEGREKVMKALDYAVKDMYIAGIDKFNRFLQQTGP